VIFRPAGSRPMAAAAIGASVTSRRQAHQDFTNAPGRLRLGAQQRKTRSGCSLGDETQATPSGGGRPPAGGEPPMGAAGAAGTVTLALKNPCQVCIISLCKG